MALVCALAMTLAVRTVPTGRLVAVELATLMMSEFPELPMMLKLPNETEPNTAVADTGARVISLWPEYGSIVNFDDRRRARVRCRHRRGDGDMLPVDCSLSDLHISHSRPW